MNRIFMYILLFAMYIYADGPNLKRIADQYEKLGRYEKAADYYIQILNKNTNDIAAYMGAKRCLLQSDKLDRFEQLIYDLQSKKRDIRYQVDLAEVTYLRGQHEKAIDDWKNLIRDNSRNHNAYSLVGAAFLQHRLYDEAIELYKSGRKTFRNQSIYVFELAHIYSVQGEYTKVTREYFKYLAKHPEQISFIETQIYRLADDAEAGDRIIKTLKRALKDKVVNSAVLHQLLAGIYTRNRQYDDAFPHYLELEKSEKKDKVKRGASLYKFAKILLEDDEYTYAAKILELIVQNHASTPYAVHARMGLAQVLEYQGRYTEAISAYRDVAAGKPRSSGAVQASLRIADIYYDRLFDLDNAQKAYRDIIKKYPNTKTAIQARFRLGDCKIFDGELSEAKDIFLDLLNSQGKRNKGYRNQALLKLAYVEFFQQQPSRAFGHLDSFLKDDDKNADVYRNDALNLALLLRENRADSLGLARLGHAQLLEFQRKYDQSIKTVKDYMPSCNNDQLKDELGMFLANLYQKTGKPDSALFCWKNLAEKETSLYTDLAYYKMAQIYEHQKNEPETARQYYEHILLHFPYSLYIEDVRKSIRNLQSLNED